jgi:hypothetical protein
VTAVPPGQLRDDFARDPPYPPDYLFPQEDWSGLGDLDDLRFLERRLRHERLIALSYVRLRERLGFALLTMDMQNRWKKEYQAAVEANQEMVTAIRDAARARPDARILLLGALDAFCTLYPDPGVRPTRRYRILCEDEAARKRFAEVLGDRVEVSAALSAGGVDVDPSPLFKGAGPASAIPAPHFEGLAITQGPPKLTRDATRTASEASRGVAPGRPRPLGSKSETSEERTLPARIDDAPNVLLMRREHAFLLAVLDWVERAGDERRGLYAWELTEMTRRWPLDWPVVVSESRRWGASALVDAVLRELAATWRAAVPEAVRSNLRGGPLARLIVRLADPPRAQALLRHPLLRRL